MTCWLANWLVGLLAGLYVHTLSIYKLLAVTRSILNGHVFKKVFWRPFSIFLFKPEVDFQYLKCQVITTIKPEHMPFEFRKSVD